MFKVILLFSAIFGSCMSSAADNISKFESGIEQNTLIELYTSEGCSSCPPAETFLNSLNGRGSLWNKWIPVAFHVDYWDYIGWKDRYATKQFGQRQSRYASLKRASTVYTPAFMVNGNSWRRGIFGGNLPESDIKVGKLNVSVKGNTLQANFQPLIKVNSQMRLNVAILAMGLTSKIERGENEGRTAKHEFVVVGFNYASSNNLNWDMSLPALHYKNAKEHALAVWVSENNNPTPIQVVGGALQNFNK